MSHPSEWSSAFGVLRNERLYTAQEVADQVFDCDVGHVYDLIALELRNPGSGLRAANIGVGAKAHWRICESDLVAFLSKRSGVTEVRSSTDANPMRSRSTVQGGFLAMIEGRKS